jgi:hypothetical protein
MKTQTMNTKTSPKILIQSNEHHDTRKRATVLVRSTSGGPPFIVPARIYLALCDVDDDGEVIEPRLATKVPHTYITDNIGARRRFSGHIEKANVLADMVNSGLMLFEDACALFVGE